MNSRAVSITIGVVGVSSLLGMIFIDKPDVDRLLQVPAVGALLGALLKVFMAINTAERAAMAKALDRSFAFGVSSPMAKAVFDRQVKFCEEYATELNAVFRTLITHAETPEALPHASRLQSLREKSALWLTADIERPLKRIESELRMLGVTARRMESDNRLSRERRLELFDDAAEKLMAILGAKFDGEPSDDVEARQDCSIGGVRRHLRSMLGVDHLTALRSDLHKADHSG